MGMFPYNTPVAVRRSTSRVNTLSMSNDSLAGGACYKSSASTATQYRQSGKSQSMRQKNRRTSIKRCKRMRSLGHRDSSSLLDDFYTSQAKCILSKISDWSFDVFALEKASNGRALFNVILKLFQKHNLIEHFQLDVVKLMTFATLVEEGYQSNPYHNATHAADVTQAMHCYITQGKIAKHMTPIETLISLVSAITHDLDHPGVNQGFLVATDNHLASLYENKAVLEKHHWRTALAVLHETGLFDHLSDAVRSQIEMEMKSMILATDMTRQQDFLARLKTRVIEDTLDMARYEDRHFILQIALKCADISNPCRHWSACKSWSDKVCEEFFRQGDFERELNLPISALCDRYSNGIPRIQTGFIDFCVQPLFTEFEKYLFPSSMLSDQLANLMLNREKWQENIDSKPTVARPTHLNIPTAVDEIPSDIPSPTVSESANDIPSPTDSDTPDFIESSHVAHILDRRHSLPVPNLLETKNLLTRRQSFPDGPSKNGHPDSVTDMLLNTCTLAEHLYQLNKQQLLQILEKQATFADFRKTLS